MMPPSASAPPIVWAVFLGCTSPQRLSTQWGCGIRAAQRALELARRRGLLHLVGSGHYGMGGSAGAPLCIRLRKVRQRNRRFYWHDSRGRFCA